MTIFNAAFFSLYEKVFTEYVERHGLQETLAFMKRLFSSSLGPAYNSSGFVKGNPEDFARVVKERDEGVGLEVKLPVVSDERIVYQFHRDPFPGLRGLVDHEDLDSCYLDFKIRHLLGEDWKYKTVKHIWKNDAYSEHIISRSVNQDSLK